MKLIVFGAAGKTGRHILRQALKRGHEVTAFVHDTPVEIKGVRTVQGDVMNEDDVARAVEGQDAVISVLGHSIFKGNTPPTMLTKGTENIVLAMQNNGIDRIITLTGTGVRTISDKPTLWDKFINRILILWNKTVIEDGFGHVSVLENSRVNWTVLRVLLLTNGDKIEKVELNIGVKPKPMVSRATVAQVMLGLVETDHWHHQMPVISKPRT